MNRCYKVRAKQLHMCTRFLNVHIAYIRPERGLDANRSDLMGLDKDVLSCSCRQSIEPHKSGSVIFRAPSRYGFQY